MKKPLKRILAENVKRLMLVVPEVATQAKLAARAHMSQSSIHRIINEDTEPEIETVGKLAEAIGVSIATLLTEGEGDDLSGIVHEKYKALPHAEKEKIKSFIEFVIASHEAATTGTPVTHTGRQDPPNEEREVAQRLNQRKPSDQTLTSHERQNSVRGRRKKPTGA
jgi:transcriptional regulator with XRE-family HTH domain